MKYKITETITGVCETSIFHFNLNETKVSKTVLPN